MSADPEDTAMLSEEPESPKQQSASRKKLPATPRKRKPAAENEDDGDALKTPTPSKRKALINSPLPKSRDEIKPYDTLLLTLREQKVSYGDVLPQFIKAGGASTGPKQLANRVVALKALSVELNDAQKKSLIDIVAEIDAAFAKDKYVKVASEMKARYEGLEISAASLKKTYEQIQH